MATLTPERADARVVQLRRGMEIDGMENPAGELFADGYTEHEITMTGTAQTGPNTNFSVWDGQDCMECCVM